MSLYRVGDEVLVNIPQADGEDDPVIAWVMTVLEDQPEGSGRDSRYIIEDEDDNRWDVIDTQITDLFSGPTHDLRMVEDDLPESLDHDEEDPSVMVDQTEEAQARRWAEATLRHEAVPPDQPAPMRFVPMDIGARMQQEFEEFQTRQVQREMERRLNEVLDRNGTVNAVHQFIGDEGGQADFGPGEQVAVEENGARGQVFRVNPNAGDQIHRAEARRRDEIFGATVANNEVVTEQPIHPQEGREVVNSIDRRISGSIGTADYNPVVGQTGRLVSFTIPHEGVLIMVTPVVNGLIYEWRDENGNAWVNQHQRLSGWNTIPENMKLRDNIRHFWASTIVLQHYAANSRPLDLGKYGKKPRKKLRRKHPIPEIKDEKYYAGKEFIA